MLNVLLKEGSWHIITEAAIPPQRRPNVIKCGQSHSKPHHQWALDSPRQDYNTDCALGWPGGLLQNIRAWAFRQTKWNRVPRCVVQARALFISSRWFCGMTRLRTTGPVDSWCNGKRRKAFSRSTPLVSHEAHQHQCHHGPRPTHAWNPLTQPTSSLPVFMGKRKHP